MDNIYDGAIYDTEDRESQEDLVINSCGRTEKQHLTVIREKGRKDFHIIYVVSGQCEVEIDGKVHTVCENGFAIYYPHKKQRYFTKTECVRFWIHFSGTNAEKLLKDFGFEQGVYSGKESHEIRELLHELTEEFILPGEKNVLKNSILLQMLVLRLYESRGSKEYINPYVSALVRVIHEDCNIELNVEHYARKAGMSEESFCHLFRKSIGVPLHKYITQVRLKEARRLLKYSSESISQIAYSVGYDDPLYFSRIFKKYYGVSPKFMRNNQG